jgi:TonB family protein
LAGQTRDLRVEPIDAVSRRSFEKQVKVALVVGIGAYPQGSGLSSLKYAVRDAEVLGATLKSQGYLVRRLTESDATRGMIRRTILELSEAVTRDEGTFLFFFGGHGFTYKGSNYLATFGTTADDLEGEGLAVKDVEELLLASKAKRKLLFVDACRNDPGQSTRSAGQRSFEKLQTSEGIRELYSTKEGHVSFEDEALRQGVFTYFLAKGLQGEAAGADGLVTFRDLADYVTDRMRAYTVERGQVQIPFEAGESSGDFLLSAGSKGGAGAPAAPPPQPTGAVPAGATQNARLISNPSPVYPQGAKSAGVTGTVELAAVIGEDGHIQTLKVVSGHALLQKAALDAVWQWVYQPTLLNGKPVKVSTTIKVNFTLDGRTLPPGTAGPDGVYVPGNGVSTPTVVHKVEAVYSEEALAAKFSGAVVLQIVVTADGSVRNPQVIKSLGLGLDRNAVEAVVQWRFSPGMKDGSPVPVEVKIEVDFRLAQ